MRTMAWAMPAVAVLLAVQAGPALAIPSRVSYQGELFVDGVPFGTGMADFKFVIFQGTSTLWSNDGTSVNGSEPIGFINDVPVTNSVFNVILGGEGSLLALTADRLGNTDGVLKVWVRTTASGPFEQLPNQPLASAAYALCSETARRSQYGFRVEYGDLLVDVGKVGIGTATPVQQLDVNGGIKIGNTTTDAAGSLRWTGTDFQGHNGTAWQSLTAGTGGGNTLDEAYDEGGPGAGRTITADAGAVDIAGPDGLTVNGAVAIGGPPADPSILDVAGTPPNAQQLAAFRPTEMSNGTDIIEMHAPSGAPTNSQYIECDNGAMAIEFKVDVGGDVTSAGAATIGTGLTVTSGTVALPPSQIEDSEIADEPGVASSTSNVLFYMTGNYDILLSRSITAPTSGYCLVIGTCCVRVSHQQGTISEAIFGVSDQSTSLPANQQVLLQFASSHPAGGFYHPVTVHGLFSVSAGLNTFYLLGREYGNSYSVSDLQLTIVFLPTAYGTVTPTLRGGGGAVGDGEVAPRPPLSAAEIEAERSESVRFNDERIREELEAMQSRIAELESKLASGREANDRK